MHALVVAQEKSVIYSCIKDCAATCLGKLMFKLVLFTASGEV